MKKMKRQCANAADDNCWYIMQLRAFDYTPVWQEIYKRKSEGDTTAKLLMNKTIGCFESIGTSYAQHFKGFNAAVIYYRHENNMLKKIDEIERAVNTIVQLATDSIAWKGQPLPESVDYVKALGNFYSEYERAQACIKSTGNYAIEVNGKVMLVKTQGGASIPDEVKKSFKSCEDILTIRETSGYSDGYELLSYDTGLGFNSFEYKKIVLKDFENVMRYF